MNYVQHYTVTKPIPTEILDLDLVRFKPCDHDQYRINDPHGSHIGTAMSVKWMEHDTNPPYYLTLSRYVLVRFWDGIIRWIWIGCLEPYHGGGTRTETYRDDVLIYSSFEPALDPAECMERHAIQMGSSGCLSETGTDPDGTPWILLVGGCCKRYKTPEVPREDEGMAI